MSEAPRIDLQPVHRLLDRHLEHEEPYEVAIGPLRLTMLPGVFCPTYTRTSEFLADHVKVGRGERVLDMFSGSGYQGLMAAARGAAVTCVDWSATAVRCIEMNAAANGFADRVEARVGDLFALVPERYDVVIANPPLLPGSPSTVLETAVFDAGLEHSVRFIEQVGDNLSDTGRCYFLASDAHKGLDLLDVEALAPRHGLTADPIADRDLGYETYTVYELRPERG